MPGAAKTAGEIAAILAAYERTGSIKAACRETGFDRDTVRKYTAAIRTGLPEELADPPEQGSDLPPGRHEPAEALPELPPSFGVDHPPFVIDTPGHWALLFDPHVPYHDRSVLDLFMRECQRRAVVGVVIGGDYLDSHEVSRHDKDPRAPRYKDEIEYGRQGLAWMRGRLPKARIVFKFGNHDERCEAYVVKNAPALFGIKGVDLESFLACDKYGVEVVKDRRVIHLGRLNVIHGHEYAGGAGSPVNPARGLNLKAKSVAVCGHHHRTSQDASLDIRGRPQAAWSVGASCHLRPMYMPLNDWNAGAAFVEVDSGGEFCLDNRRVWQGKFV